MTIEEMRTKCCEHESKSIAEDPDNIDKIYAILMLGCTGWANLDDDAIIQYFEENELK